MTLWQRRVHHTARLGSIGAEITSVKKTLRDRSVADTERLADLRKVQRRITSGGRRGCY